MSLFNLKHYKIHFLCIQNSMEIIRHSKLSSVCSFTLLESHLNNLVLHFRIPVCLPITSKAEKNRHSWFPNLHVLKLRWILVYSVFVMMTTLFFVCVTFVMINLFQGMSRFLLNYVFFSLSLLNWCQIELKCHFKGKSTIKDHGCFTQDL